MRRRLGTAVGPLGITLGAGVLCVGCTTMERAPRSAEALAAAHAGFDASAAATERRFDETVIRRMEREWAAFEAGESGEPPVLDILALSGGADSGAFGASFLDAWGLVPPDHGEIPSRPEFDVVTGISTGALIAPMAFVGTEASYAACAATYRRARPEWLRSRGLFGLLPSSPSLMDTAQLEREIYGELTDDVILAIADGAAEMFAPETMKALSELGAQMARDPHAWKTKPPVAD